MPFDKAAAQEFISHLEFIFSEFNPIESERATKEEQRVFHEILGKIISTLYGNPSILKLTDSPKQIEREIKLFYALLMHGGRLGMFLGSTLTITTEQTKDINVRGVSSNVKIKDTHAKLLSAVGFNCRKDRKCIKLRLYTRIRG